METNDRDYIKKFLTAGTEKGLGDLSMMVSVLAEILTTHEREVREKTLKEVYQMLLRTEAILAQRGIDVPDEYSEDSYYNRGYFEAIDDTAKLLGELLLVKDKN